MNSKRELDSEILQDFLHGRLPDHLVKSVEDFLLNNPQALSQLELTEDDSFIIALRQAAQEKPQKTAQVYYAHWNSENLPDFQAISDKLAKYQFKAVLKTYGHITTALAIRYENDQSKKVVVRLFTAKPDRIAEEIQRFQGEAETLKSLQHPNIVRYVDSEIGHQNAFLAMEFIDGLDLSKLLAEIGPLPFGTVSAIAVQILEALQYLEQHQIVHRDIKPSNIILGNDGVVRLIDFGLAKSLSRQQDNSLTGSSYFLGTLDYISPEQAMEARKVDIRSDLYSVGCTLYTLLTGRPPFSSGGLANPLKKVLAHALLTPASIHEIAREVPIEMCDGINRLLAKDPQQRFSTPEDAQEVFKAYENPSDFQTLIARVQEIDQRIHSSLWSTDIAAKTATRAEDSTLLTILRTFKQKKLIASALALSIPLTLLGYYHFSDRMINNQDAETATPTSQTHDATPQDDKSIARETTNSSSLPLREGYYGAVEKNVRTLQQQTAGIIISGNIFAYTTPDRAAPGQLRRVGCLWKRLEGHALEAEGKLVYAEQPAVQGYLIVEYPSPTSFLATCWRGNDFTLEEALKDSSKGYFHSTIEGEWFSPDIQFAGPAIQLHPDIAHDWRSFIGKIAPQCLPASLP